MTEGSLNRVLYNVDQRADTTAAEKKTARDNIGAVGADDITEITDQRYKLLQSPVLQTFSANAVIDRLEQDPQGVTTIHCSYLSGDQLVPPATSADDGKILVVDPDGHPEWQDAGAGLLTVAHDSTLSGDGTVSAPLGVNLDEVQGKLTAGDNISIVNNVISAASQVNADWDAVSGVSAIINKPTNLVQDADYHHTDNNFTTSEKTKLAGIQAGAEKNVQVDWNCEDTSSDQYVLNRPTIPVIPPMKELVAGSGIGLVETEFDVTISATTQSDNNFTDAYKNKLDGIESGAEKNVNADWNAVSGDAAILNKPTVPELSWQQVTQGSSVSYPADQLKVHRDNHAVTMHTTGGSDVQLGYVAPNPQSTDDGKVLTAVSDPTDGVGVQWADAPESHTVGFINI